MRSPQRFALPLLPIAVLAAASVAPAAGRRDARPAIITKITVVGNQKVPLEDIMARIRVQEGDEMRPDELDRDARRIERIKGIADVVYTTKKAKRGVELTFEVIEEGAPAVEKKPAPEPPAKKPPGDASEAPKEASPAEAPPRVEATPKPPIEPEKPAVAPLPAPRAPEVPAAEEPLVIGTGTPGAAKVGVVDWEQIARNWKAAQAMAQENQQLQRMPAMFQRELAYRRLLVSLTADETERTVELWSKERLTEKQKKDLERLETMAKQRDQRFADLQSNTNRTDDEQSEYALLKETRDNAQRRLRELEEEYRAQLTEASRVLGEKDRIAGMKVREMVGEVARELGLELVFRYEYLLYGGLDITPNVIDRLNQEVMLLPEPE